MMAHLQETLGRFDAARLARGYLDGRTDSAANRADFPAPQFAQQRTSRNGS